jgi:hypothetical protein
MLIEQLGVVVKAENVAKHVLAALEGLGRHVSFASRLAIVGTGSARGPQVKG